MSIKMKLVVFWASIALVVINVVFVVAMCVYRYLYGPSYFQAHLYFTVLFATDALMAWLIPLYLYLALKGNFPFYRKEALAAIRWLRYTRFNLDYFPSSVRSREWIVETGWAWAKDNLFLPLGEEAAEVFLKRDRVKEALNAATEALNSGRPATPIIEAASNNAPAVFLNWEVEAARVKSDAEVMHAMLSRKADFASKRFNKGWDYLVSFLGDGVKKQAPLRNPKELLDHCRGLILEQEELREKNAAAVKS